MLGTASRPALRQRASTLPAPTLASDALATAYLTLDAIRAAAIPVAYLNGSLAILLAIIKAIEVAEANKDACTVLLTRAVDVVKAVSASIERTAGSDQHRALLIARIAALERALKEVQEFVDKASKTRLFIRIIRNGRTTNDITKLQKDLDDCLSLFTIDTVLSTEERISQLQERVDVLVETVSASSQSPEPEYHPLKATCALNDYLMGEHELEKLKYHDIKIGEDHVPDWTVICTFDGNEIGRGTGKKKNVAKEIAAAYAYRSLTGITCQILVPAAA